MPTFIYSPGVKVFIQTSKRGRVDHGLVDVTEDLVEGNMQRRSDGISTFQFSLSNPRRKYDSVFTPNDRIVVMMKRLAWVRTYTGLLNSVPLVTAWPMTVPLSSSCSLKRLQYWFWDPNASATQNMIMAALATGGASSTNTDGGITNVILTILNDVVGWPASKVHIAQIPPDWCKIAEKVAKDVDALAEESDVKSQELLASLSRGGFVGGVVSTGPSAVNGKLVDGVYGDADLKGEQLRNAEIIYSVCKSLGGTDNDVVIGLITAKAESQIKTGAGVHQKDLDSVGMFQQRPSMGWGTVAQCSDPTYSAKKFYSVLLKLSDRDTKKPWQAAQAVQRSAFSDGSNYRPWVSMAEAIVRSLSGALIAPAPIIGTQANTGERGIVGQTINTANAPAAEGTANGAAFARQGCDFVSRWPNIPYKYGAPRDVAYLMREPPPLMDCSSFVLAIYMRLLGAPGGMVAQTDAIVSWCKAQGAKRLTTVEAFATPGAVVLRGPYPGTTHIEITLGDGVRTVGTGSGFADVQTWTDINYFDFGYQLPNLSYGGQSPVVPGAVSGSDPAADQANQTLGSDVPGYNPNDVFDKMFGNNSWTAKTIENDPELTRAEYLTGIRALMNDHPLMDYLMSLFQSQMRSFSSAPNGDLIAWFPDYYGIWGTSARMIVEPIEVKDFTVEWSDDSFVTHQFTVAGNGGPNYLNISSGEVTTSYLDALSAQLQTVGIASIDIPALMWSLFGVEATKEEANSFADYIYKRFGARPAYQAMDGLIGPKAEFFSAIYMFMRQWAYQYNADIPLTFMPELYPGMLIQIPKFDFQAYVTTVTHTFQFGEGGGFTTTVNICAPARLPKKVGDRDGALIGLPLAGDYKPGRGVGNVNPTGRDLL